MAIEHDVLAQPCFCPACCAVRPPCPHTDEPCPWIRTCHVCGAGPLISGFYLDGLYACDQHGEKIEDPDDDFYWTEWAESEVCDCRADCPCRAVYHQPETEFTITLELTAERWTVVYGRDPAHALRKFMDLDFDSEDQDYSKELDNIESQPQTGHVLDDDTKPVAWPSEPPAWLKGHLPPEGAKVCGACGLTWCTRVYPGSQTPCPIG